MWSSALVEPESQIETGETHPMPLPNGLKPAGLSWFPDSAHVVAVLNGGDGRSGLWEISTLGGNARKLSDEGRLPEVSPDGREIGCGGLSAEMSH
jgi:hypothetical protein